MAANMNNHVFKGHKTLLGSKYVTYGEVELPLRYDLYSKANSGFDWGHNGPASMQLAFSILYQVSNQETAMSLTVRFTQEVVKKLNSRDWVLNSFDVIDWITATTKDLEIQPEVMPIEASNITEHSTVSELTLVSKPAKKSRPRKDNVVKAICKDLNITQKQLAEILEVPEGTVSSWAVKNEIPRLGKKAIEFYTVSTKNQKIVDSYKDFIHLLQAS